MKKILLFVFLVSSVFSFGQTIFQKTYGGTDWDQGECIQRTIDGGYIISGGTFSYGAGNYDVYLVKTNAVGDTLWTKTIGGSSDEYGWYVSTIAEEGYIVTGYTLSVGAGTADVLLIRTDAAGNPVWQKTYGGLSADVGICVKPTTDGGFIVSAHSFSFTSSNYDAYLLKTDANGTLLWSRSYGAFFNDIARSVHQTPDNGFIMVGTTFNTIADSNDVYVIRTDSVGDTLWTKAIGGSGIDDGEEIKPTADGGFIIAGETRSFGAGNFDACLIKIDANGNSEWSKTYGGVGVDFGFCVQQTTDGGFILGGYTNSFGAGSTDAYLNRTDSLGNLLWSKTIGGVDWEQVSAIDLAPGGGFTMTGLTESFGSGQYDMYLIKTDSSGESGCHTSDAATIVTSAPMDFTASSTTETAAAAIVAAQTLPISNGANTNSLCFTVSTGPGAQNAEPAILVFPNPFSGNLTISHIGDAVVTLCDYTGKEILHQRTTTGEAILNTESLAAGLYFLRVEDGREVRNYKVVKAD
jgi:hypothetical protein